MVISAALAYQKARFASEIAVFKVWYLNGDDVHLWWYQRLWCIENSTIHGETTNASLPRENSIKKDNESKLPYDEA
jgi:hypothetical protein